MLLLSLLGGCGGDEAIEMAQVEEPVQQEPVPVGREWFPSPKHQPIAPAAVPPAAGQVAPTAPGYPAQYAPAATGQWTGQPAQPVYVTPQAAYTMQPVVPQYQQPGSVWSVPQPAAAPQSYWYAPAAQVPAQPPVYYAPVARPWGNPVAPADPQQPAITTESWPQGAYNTAPWSLQPGATGTVPVQPTVPLQPYGGVMQPYNTVPSYGHVW